jgi:hypothetical protein
MKKILLSLFLGFLSTSFVFSQATALSIIGDQSYTGTTTAQASPVNNYFRRQTMHFVLTKEELTRAGFACNYRTINQLSWYITNSFNWAKPGYTIKMKHVTANDASASLGTGGWTTVRTAFTYGVPAVNAWSAIDFTTNFVWNGNDNIAIEVCWSQTGDWTNTGALWVTNQPSGMRYTWDDNTGSLCGVDPGTVVNYKPTVRLRRVSSEIGAENAAPGSGTTLAFTAANACSNGSFSLGAGAFYDLVVQPHTSYNFTWANGGTNMSGFCARPTNGNGIGFNGNVVGWYSGTTTTLRVTAIRANQTWVATSATMTYRHTLPATPADITGTQTVCIGGTRVYASALPTGGTVTTGNGYRIHRFTGNGTLTIPTGFTGHADVLVVAGGGGGGRNGGGGGGGGGVVYRPNFTLASATSYTVTVGNGGAGATTNAAPGSNGGNSVFSTITAIGGGGGASRDGGAGGQIGGSGGGGAGATAVPRNLGGRGTFGQGGFGGGGTLPDPGCNAAGGGGGGFTSNGTGARNNIGGAGGAGFTINMLTTGNLVYGSGGGGGVTCNDATRGAGGNGAGAGGGSTTLATNGIANRGGGGGGGQINAGNGGSGVVIVRYKLPTWSSSNGTLATIAANGTITGVAAGTPTMTYSNNNNGCTNNKTRTVTVQTAPTAPTSITGITTLCSGNSTTLTAAGGSNGSGATYQWGTGATIGSNIIGAATNVSYTTPILTGNTTYWVRRVGNTACTNITDGVAQLVTVNTLSTAPTGITGTTTICNGSSTTLTAAGGTNGTQAVNVWYSGSCNEAFEQPWNSQPYGVGSTTVNNTNNGILNVTSTTNDPMINMYGLGSFNPAVYRYVNIRYRVAAGTAGNVEIFFTNGNCGAACGGQMVNAALNSDGAWRTVSVPMFTHALWTHSNVTGWRFDWATATGVTMEIDFINLTADPMVGWGNSITVSPTTTTTYFTAKKGTCNTTTCASTTVTVRPTPTVASISQATNFCNGAANQINLTGLVPSSTFTINYTINAAAQTAVTVASNGSGQGSFNTPVLSFTNSGQTLALTSIAYSTAPACSQSVTNSLTLQMDPIQVNATIGLLGPTCYPNMQSAFNAINNGTHRGAVTIRVNGNVTHNATALLEASGTGPASYTSLKIFPTAAGRLLTGSTNAPIINLNGADNVIIDGRINETGASKSLTITNTNTGTTASVIQLINGATSNTIRDLIISGAGAGTARGMIFLTTDVITTSDGNSNNLITNNNFTGINATTSRPYMCIYSLGTAGKLNRNNTVSNNNFFDFYRTSSTTYGVYAHTNSSNWTITGNHFYETTNLVVTGNASYINIRVLDATNGTGHVISNNFIGGKAPNAGGGQMNISSSTNQPIYYGILANSSNGTATPSSMNGNTIANLSINSRHNTVFRGIQIDGGTWNVGTSSGNIIGSSTGTGNIVLTSPLDRSTQVVATATATVSGGVVQTPLTIGTNTAIYTTVPTVTFSGGGGTGATATAVLASNGTISAINVTNGGSGYTSAPTVTIANPTFSSLSYGILLNSTGTLDIRNNQVASINVVGNTNWSHSFYAIYRNTAVGVSTTLNNNNVGSSTANSINCLSASSNGTGQSLWGIASASNSPVTISSNIIENLRNEYTGTATASYTRGIQVTNGSNTITDNTVRNIYTASANAGSTTNSTLGGIHVAATSASTTQNISNNLVHNLSASNSSAAVNVQGIYFGAVAAGTHTISRNFIHNLTSASSNGTAAIFGIRLNSGTSTISNNIINLGSSSEQPTSKTIYGIFETGTSGNNYGIYFNTIRIGGLVTSGTGNTFALHSNGTANTRNIRNNLFVNARSNSGGSGSHYAAWFNQTANTGFTVDYNDYFVTGTGGVLGRYNGTNVTLLPIVASNDVNSYSANPQFSTNPPTTVASHHRPTCGLVGITGTGVTQDYGLAARANPPSLGAYEVTNRTPFVDDMTATACSGSAFTVTPINGTNGVVPFGTTYSWGVPSVSGGMTGGASGTNATNISGNLVNSTNNEQIATYVVTPSSGGCVGTAFTLVVTVRPTPSATISGTASICVNASSPTVTFTNPRALPITVTYNINNAGNQTINVGASTTATLSAPTTTAGTFNYNLVSVVYQNAPTCSNNITGTATITVNPNPTANAGGALAAICQGGTSAAMGGSVGGGATGGTWSGGAGTWTNASNPATATYTAGAAESGSITLTLTTSGGSCGTTTATKNITVNPNPTANAGGALAAICQGGTSAQMGGSVGGGATGGTWSGGAGTWTNASNPNTATYTAGAVESGSITLTLTTSGGSCGTTTATKNITVNPNPTANAGGALAAICQGGTSAAMGGSVGGGATGGTWSGGAGTWTNASNPATATYTAGTAESGSITLTLTTSGGSCGTTTATKNITVNPNPTANAGGALAAICQGGTSAQMGGSVGGGATGGTWSGGAGTWTNASNPNTATYTAGAAESGSITLTLTTSGGSCGTTTATKNITVNPNPTANAGGALAAICQGGTSAAMGGSVGGGATGGTWSGGAGSWTNASNPATATYTAGGAESGSITLTLTTSGGSCGTTTTTKNITVNPNPTANAGGALAAICQGGTSAAMGGSVGGGATGGTWSGGAGTWTNASNPATATYTAGAAESGSITLTLTTSGGSCGITTATKNITVNPNPTANAGGALAAICQGGTSAQMGGSVGGGATGGTWSGGAGTWTNASNPNTATYTAGAAESGSITLTLTTSGGSCGTTTATKNITVNPNPTANAGGALAAICQGGTSAAMGGSVGGGATGGTWSGGAGSWTNASNPATATYTAGTAESGSITLTLTTSGGSCGTTTATKNITVNPNPTANAGGALAAICQGGTSAAMGGSVGGGATGGTWSGGAGTWTNASNPATATYTAGAAESGSITLTLTTSGGSCGTTTATKNITVNPNPTANAGGALAAICQGATSAQMGGSVGGGATGGTWSGGAGTWTNASNPNTATYTAGAAESGSITLTLTTSGGSCGTTTATKNITVNPLPSAPTNPIHASNCGSGTLNFEAEVGVGETIDWYDAAGGGNLLLSGNTVYSVMVTSNVSYYAQTRNTSTGCVSTARTAVYAVLAPIDKYRSDASGNWTTTSNWEQSCDNGGTWVAATNFPTPSEDVEVRIMSGNTISMNANYTNSTPLNTIVIESGATLNQSAGQNFETATITINGTFVKGTNDNLTGNITVSSTGKYQHDFNGGTIPAATWASGSTLEITGVTNATSIGGMNQAFSNVVFNSNNSSDFEIINSGVITTDDFTVLNTGTAGSVRFTGNATVNVNGDFSIDANNNLVTTGSGLVFNLKGDFNNDGIANFASNLVKFDNSTSNQNISGSSVTTFHNLEIDKGVGLDVVLTEESINVDNELRLTAGNINLNDRGISLGTTGFIANEDETHRIYCNCPDGFIRRVETIGASYSGNPGNMGLTFGNSGPAMGSTEIVRRHRVAGNNSVNPLSINRSYAVSPSSNNGSLDLTLEMRYLNVELHPGASPNDFVYYRTPNGIDWFRIDDNITANPSTKTILVTGWSQFSELGGGNDDNSPLPIKLSKFDLACSDNDNVSITWQTSSEISNDYFTIERSIDGFNYEVLATVNSQAMNGNSNTILNYKYDDKEVPATTVYYRLKQTDFDGSSETFSPQAIDCNDLEGKEVLMLIPNPARESVRLNVVLRKSDKYVLQVIDNKGANIYKEDINLVEGINNQYLDITNYPSGVYSVILINNNGKYLTKRLVVQK